MENELRLLSSKVPGVPLFQTHLCAARERERKKNCCNWQTMEQRKKWALKKTSI
jgi:hypothetical protein